MTPSVLWISPSAYETELARQAQSCLREAEVCVSDEDPRTKGYQVPIRKVLRIALHEGPILRPLQVSECSQRVLPEAFLACGCGCPAACTYCVLSVCLSVPVPTVYGDIEAIVSQLREELSLAGPSYLHLGHILDPLAYPFFRPLLTSVVELLRDFSGSLLEIRTKFASVDLLPASPPRSVIVAFSFSPERIVSAYERGTAGLGARIRAARRAFEKGYKIGIRLDPLIVYPGWEREYADLYRLLLSSLPSEGVRDVVAGCFRGPPALLDHITLQDEAGLLRQGEFVPVGSGKVSYPRPLRIRALRHVAARLGGRYPVRFCFEGEEVQQAVYSRPPRGLHKPTIIS